MRTTIISGQGISLHYHGQGYRGHSQVLTQPTYIGLSSYYCVGQASDHIPNLTTQHSLVFLLNSRSSLFTVKLSYSYHKQLSSTFIPKLQVHFAEFPNEHSPKALVYLHPSIFVDFRYSYLQNVVKQHHVIGLFLELPYDLLLIILLYNTTIRDTVTTYIPIRYTYRFLLRNCFTQRG